MSDFEKRVRDTLAGQADKAPGDASGLADAARARRGRRRTAIGGAVVAAAVVAAIPLGLALVDRGDSGGRDSAARESTSPDTGAADPASDLPEIPDGWRWESWRNVEVAVPGDWRDGSAYDLCIPGAPNQPAGNISRDAYQADFEPDVEGTASCPQGVTFLAGTPKEPIAAGDGVAKRVSLAGNTLDVVAADQETLDQVVASAHEITETDSLGCAPSIEFGTAAFGEAEGAVTMCDYVIGGYGSDRSTPVLDSSRTLKEAQGEQLTAALTSTRTMANAAKVDPGCTLSKGAPPVLVHRLQVGDVVLVDIASSDCGGTQIVTGDGPQQLDYALLDAVDPATMSLG
ncbi:MULTISPECIES: hypothetical protein [unclassified Nocardioides]|uniref:hypothetical protein n=1 Tax=unclassified Nocardioides TaxID=2615069 RepID=UPI0006F5841A|nr:MULTISPECIES: hypothetical protein [unclassified Nocardioides]KQY56595.1 hypothetical protein ASD30_09730 [Nocardioides sp. Root140]KQZ75354.1 hypothetical protein ASD66_03045 [Nocardioides sp. Root151]KRF14428.1 hypothetical protein ASH02_08835 [Nocardioides sp. Soil796]